MKELIKLVLKRAPWPVALALSCVVLYLIYVDEEARHQLLTSLVSASNDLDWAQTALIGVLAWIGNRVHTRLDELTTELKAVRGTITEFDKDIREDIEQAKTSSTNAVHNVSERLAVVEERCDRFDMHRAETCPFHSKT